MAGMGLRYAWLCLLLLSADVQGIAAKRNYHFDGKISREVLENYLSRSITMTEIYRSPGNLDDDIRMLKNIGAKFAGRTIYLWGAEARIADPKFLAQGREMAARIHQNDPDVVLQAAVFEIVTQQGVSQVPVPDWVFQRVRAAGRDAQFRLFEDAVSGREAWSITGGGDRRCPDICQPETKMWFFFLAASYMNIGIEAIHFGQFDLMGRNDPEYRNWADLLKHVRGYAQEEGAAALPAVRRARAEGGTGGGWEAAAGFPFVPAAS